MNRMISATAALTLLLAASSAHGFESTRISVSTVGSGPDVVLIPGLNSSPEVWDELVSTLGAYEVHLVHVNGFAGAPAGANGEGAVVEPVAAEVARYIAETQLEDTTVIGHSMGAVVATLVASRNPELVERVMSIDIPAFFGDIMGVPPEQIGAMAEQMREQALARSGAERDATEVAFITNGIMTEAERAHVIADMRRSDPVVGANAQRDIMVTNLKSELPAISAEMAVVFVTPAMAPQMTQAEIEEFYASQYAGAADLSLHYVADSGHYVMLDQPEVLAGIVRDFLR